MSRRKIRKNEYYELEKTFCLCNSDLCLNHKYNLYSKIPNEKTQQKRKFVISDLNFLVFYGHGTETEMIGQDKNAMVDIDNAHLLRGWVIYAMACKTAKVLGPAVIDAGGLAYIGYTDHFNFLPGTHEVFGECVNTIPLELGRGKSTGEALRIGREKFDYYIEKYKKMYADEDDSEIKDIYRKTYEYLILNKNSLVLLGNSYVTINYNLFKYW